MPIPCEPLALVLNLDTPKGAAVRQVLLDAGVTVRPVLPRELGDPVGYLVGLPGFSPAPQPYAGAVPTEEFLLLCHLPDEQVLELVRAMRLASCPVGCKATLTEHNRSWPFAQLVEEVAHEHAAMAHCRA